MAGSFNSKREPAAGARMKTMLWRVSSLSRHFLWRPFLRDANDDMVLELAFAAGHLGGQVAAIYEKTEEFTERTLEFLKRNSNQWSQLCGSVV